MGALKRIDEIIREKASELKKKKPVLKFKIRLALIKFRTAGSRGPGVPLAMKICAQRKAGRRKRAKRRFVSSHSRFAFACVRKIGEVPENEAGPIS